MADWRYLTSAELIELSRPHGAGPVIKPEGLESAVAAPARTFGGDELYPDVADKAAALAYGVVKVHHPFMDGNKRTAAIGMLTFCYVNGFVPMITQSELVALIVLAARGDADQAAMAGFVRDRLS
ncbi:Fic family protein [Actinosynnema sp. NPDC047251]|uniref:Fido domain-containing protein n=1 Tax=Saccharothrix espanaensis (strain ATCC 51144 / DSM 44229 / JCM 9112 / NBRC 15066 / NRRL 15764) TaxID=1179773 RepID=K0KFN9_SACES|nr:Fic family protein [Saccharothrix espanaensis]CCH35569.1 hypothetical protein BN6_83530 [Saccharothrix espanaensis DSM 44229]